MRWSFACSTACSAPASTFVWLAPAGTDRRRRQGAGATLPSIPGGRPRQPGGRGPTTGGVGHGEALRAELVPAGMSLLFRWLGDAVNGEGHHRGAIRRRRVRALRRWRLFWQLVSRHAQVGQAFSPSFPDRAAGPGCRDAQGRGSPTKRVRYHHFVEAMVRHLQRGTGGDAAWLVCDAASYALKGVILPGTRRLIADPPRLCSAWPTACSALAQRRHRSRGAALPPRSGPTTMLQLAVTRTSTRAMRRSTVQRRIRPTDRTLVWAKSANRPSSLGILPADAASSSGAADRCRWPGAGPRWPCRQGLMPAATMPRPPVMGATYPPGNDTGAWPSSLPGGPRCLRRVVASARAHPIEEKP